MAIYLAEAYLHRLDSFAIEFPAGWPLPGIRWYGVAYLAGFIVGWLLVWLLAAKHRTAIPRQSVADLMIYLLIGVLVGGRLGYCVFYDPTLLTEVTSTFPFWGVLAIHKGGMASHGGVIGVIAACCVFGARNHIPKLHVLDVVALAGPPGLFLGRVANFVNAELWGRALPDARQADPPWWSIKYLEEILHEGFPHATELAKLRPVVGGDETFKGNVVQAIRDGDAAITEAVRPMLTAHYPSQLLQAITDGPLLGALLVVVWWRARKPGVVGSWFLIGYGVMRIVTEFARQPDAALLQTPLGDLTRGQVLSLLMVASGLVALFICTRREVEPIGGLGKT